MPPASKYPAGDSRKKACQELLRQVQTSQQQLRVWTRPGDYNSASFAGSLAIVKNGKPFTDGEYAKTFMLDVANELFDDLPNKDKIIKRIQDMPLSARTVHDRTIIMANQVEATQSFKARFGEFREHSSLFKFITHPNECSLNTADLSYIPDVTVRDFEAEVADLKASEMWRESRPAFTNKQQWWDFGKAQGDPPADGRLGKERGEERRGEADSSTP
ncbi:hypothetical protein D4764_13G0012680 [Takifugu flavidus]|uniref:Uncharacterized protein n=1 Tax=Takifugu flavidus TaxID=433684 RepID=A0A5C6PBP4_9TELE|nr:hypothetical protein D4764_13G0012680 [Takifugu flavidus]